MYELDPQFQRQFGKEIVPDGSVSNSEKALVRTEVEKGRETLHAQTQQAEAQRKALSAAVEQARKQSIDAARFASEAVWAETFNNTVNGSAWLKNTAF